MEEEKGMGEMERGVGLSSSSTNATDAAMVVALLTNKLLIDLQHLGSIRRGQRVAANFARQEGFIMACEQLLIIALGGLQCLRLARGLFLTGTRSKHTEKAKRKEVLCLR